MAGTASSGLVVDGNLETGIKGLFAAGDEVGGTPLGLLPRCGDHGLACRRNGSRRGHASYILWGYRK